jgi:hypothetical protein
VISDFVFVFLFDLRCLSEILDQNCFDFHFPLFFVFLIILFFFLHQNVLVSFAVL